MSYAQRGHGRSSIRSAGRSAGRAIALAAAAAGVGAAARPAGAAYYVGWGGGSGNSWFTPANWPGGEPATHNYDIPFFSNTNGNYAISIDQPGSLAEGLYIGGGVPGLANNYVISATAGNALNLQMFSTTVNDGYFGNGVVFVQDEGHGSDVISAPVNFNSGNNTGLMVSVTNVTNPFTISGPITGGDGVGNPLPMYTGNGGSATFTGGTTGVSTYYANGSGTVIVGGAANYAGLGVVANSGTVVLAVTGAGNHAVGAGGLVVNAGGTVQLAAGNGDQVADSAPVTVNAGGVFDTNGQAETVGSLTLSGTGPAGGGALVHGGVGASSLSAATGMLAGDTTVGVPNAAATLTLNAHLAGSAALTKVGAGTLVIAGANTYTNGTTVAAGTLSVTGSILGTTTVNAGVLAGNGSAGAVSLGGGAIHPGASAADNSFGTLAVSSLSTTSGDIRFDLGGAASDVINDAGAASFNGGTISVALDSAPTAGSYTILTAAGGITGTPTLSTTGIGRTSYALRTVGNSLVLNVTGSPASLVWGKVGGTGDGTTWDDVQSNKNWSNAGVADTFYDGDAVTFNDANGGLNAVTVKSLVTPSSVTFANSTWNYTFTGTGGINGSTGVTLTGTGAVTMAIPNTYTGVTAVNAGTLVLAAIGAIAGNVVVAAAGTFNLAGGTLADASAVTDNGTVNLSAASTVNGRLTGTGTVNLNGNTLSLGGAGGIVPLAIKNGTAAGSLTVTAGTTVLTGANTYSGPTTVAGGATLQIGTGGTAGSLGTSTAITANGTLVYNLSGAVSVPNAIAVNGAVAFTGPATVTVTGVLSGGGAFQQSGAGVTVLSSGPTNFSGPFNVGGGTLTFNSASPLVLPNPLNGVGTGTVQNVGKLTFAGPQTFGTSTTTYNVSSVAGTLADGVPADVELTGPLNGGAAGGLGKTGPGTLAISGSDDNPGLGASVSGGTLLLNKQSNGGVHAIGSGGLTVNAGGTARLAGTGGDQIDDTVGTVTVNDGGTLETAGRSEQVYNLTLGSTTAGTGGTLANSTPGTASVVTVGSAPFGDATGTLRVSGNANLFAAAGSSLELQFNGQGPASGATQVLTTTGPGTVLLSGGTDDTSTSANVSAGTLVLAKQSAANPGVHAVTSVVGVAAGATLRLAGSGGDQIYDGYPINTEDWGVLNMNGTFDLNGQTEAFDKLTGTGAIVNSQPGTQSVLTLGTNGLIGPTAPTFAGSITGNVALTLNVNLTAANGTPAPLTLSGVNSYTGPTTVSAGTLQVSGKGSLPLATGTFHGTDLTIAGGASVVAVRGAAETAIQLDSLNNNGLLDLGNNALDLYAANASLSSVTATLTAGYNAGAFNGATGIASSAAAADARRVTTLGVILNDNGAGRPLYGASGTVAATFNGVVPTLDDVLVKYTYFGDANLDGKVNGLDYGRIDVGYAARNTGSPLTGWYNGDFNYDGKVDGSDYTLIDNAFNLQGATLSSAIVATSTAEIAPSAVPEPASAAVVMAALSGGLVRRRRRLA